MKQKATDVASSGCIPQISQNYIPPLKIFYHNLMIMLRTGEYSSSSSKSIRNSLDLYEMPFFRAPLLLAEACDLCCLTV